MGNFISDFSGKEFAEEQKVSARNIKPILLHYINKENPDFNRSHFLSQEELNNIREKFFTEVLTKKLGNLNDMERQVVSSISKNTVLSQEVERGEEKLTFGQKIADKVAEFGGSWTFIISFIVFLFLWAAFNALILSEKAFDPYPFILLNLILSCIAALQAPIIMMSQKRQEEKDRERAKKDYKINLKSEIEIRELHEKLDTLILDHQQDLLEIQKRQTELLEEILALSKNARKSDIK